LALLLLLLLLLLLTMSIRCMKLPVASALPEWLVADAASMMM
jgi:hypothetical protein